MGIKTLTIPDRPDPESLQELHEEVIAVLRQPDPIEFDLNGCELLDCGVLQLMLCVRSRLQERGQGLRLRSVGERLHRWLEFAGASSLLPVPTAEGYDVNG